MSITESLKELVSSIIVFLNTPEMIPVIAGAVIGAIFAVLLTLIVGFFSSVVKQIETNRRVRGVMTFSLKNNQLMCHSNLGLLGHEIEGMTNNRTFILTPLFTFQTSGANLIFSNASFSRFEVENLWNNLSDIDAINSQLNIMVENRQFLQLKIRGESKKSIEWELSGLLVEYDRYLIQRYNEALLIINNALHILNMSFFERVVLRFTFKNTNSMATS
ncbi:hypothetical protein CXF80_17100 [Shewanella sp. Actino-trap-3]|uniref:hypothetical protein n=1 Tax=Shewanella sp. Actino-trap-3 TaxID=2058331 RepID=UPI000C31CCB8|nr:hypothetical protein [Shewanella sp. Actino-trap-3]PKG79886.1 hypothetical protein CXF80_17100 [Shewanella sp. Actino-trap-3]